jgi:hypothetical protein
MSYSNPSKMNLEISEEQKQFLEQVDGVCKSIRDYEGQCYLEEKFNDKEYLVYHGRKSPWV